MTPSKALFYFCISFVAGIFLQSAIKIPQIFVWGILILTVVIILTFLLLKKNNFVVFGFCLLLFSLGIIRLQITEFNILGDKLSQFNDKGEVVFEGVVVKEPDIRDNSQNLKIKAGNSLVLLTVQRYPEYKYLDTLKIKGKLKTPGETEDFSYKNYLMKDGIYSVMTFPKVELVGQAKPNLWQKFYSGIIFIREKLRQSIEHNFLPPYSSILEGTILGDNAAMSAELKNKLNITGLRHIIAVSGTHVVIISSLIMSLLLAVGLWRRQAFIIAIIFICFYIILTGLPASGVRAGIMGGLYLFAQFLGRQSNGLRIIVLACAVMLLINPLLLFFDVGFQLSFLAVLGLIIIEPIVRFVLESSFQKIKWEQFSEIIKMVSTTIAAQIFTLPILVYNFGNVSYVSPITNILVLPIVYWLMVFGFMASVLGVFSNLLGWIFSFPCWMLLSYFLKIIDIFSQSWMAQSIQNVSWLWLVVYYLIISFAVRFFYKRYFQKF